MKENIKQWYANEYPSDTDGIEGIDEKVTFDDIFNMLDSYKDVYPSLGNDSIVRERVFERLSNIIGVDYNYVYDQWLLGGR